MPENKQTDREYITTLQAEQISGLRKNYLTLLLRQGSIEGFRLGRDWLIYTDSLKQFLATPRKPGPKGPRKNIDATQSDIATSRNVKDSRGQDREKRSIAIDEQLIRFFEEETATHWDVYRTGGTLRAYRRLDLWLKELSDIVDAAKDSVWHHRVGASLSMAYQLQGSILTDVLKYEQAHEAFEKAYHMAFEIDDPELMSAALARHGVTYIQQHKPKTAISSLNRALSLVNDMPLPLLKGYIYKALSEAYAMEKQADKSSNYIDLAEKSLLFQEELQERSHCEVNASSILAQKGINAVLLGRYEEAITLIENSLRTYNHAYIRGRARLMAQQAEAYFGLQRIDECTETALEAFALADSAGSSKTLQRLKKLYRELANSRWKRETGVIQLGSMLTHQ